MKNKRLLAALLTLPFIFAGCSKIASNTQETSASKATTAVQTVSEIEYDSQSAEKIDLSEQNDPVEITSGGAYLLTGSTTDGMITVDAGEDEVVLILKDAEIGNPDSSPIYIKSAGKVEISLEGTNTLTNGGSFGIIDGEELDSIVYCKTDLILTGEGTLQIVSPSGHAIVCKDNLVISGGTYNIEAGEDGINTNDSLTVTGGTFNVTSGDDAFHTDGVLTVDSGAFTITAAEGLEGTIVVINDGEITINASDDGINAAHKDESLSPYIEINGGNVDITMGQGDTDGIDSNGDIIINGGTISINGQSSCDYDGTASLNGGTLIVNGQETNTIPNQFMGGNGGEGGMTGEPPQGQGGMPNGRPEGMGPRG